MQFELSILDVLKYYLFMKFVIVPLIIIFILISIIPVSAEINEKSSGPCMIMGLDVCDKSGPLIITSVEIPCVSSYTFILQPKQEERICSAFTVNAPFLPSLKKDKPPRI
jgi:hypothetical protein